MPNISAGFDGLYPGNLSLGIRSAAWYCYVSVYYVVKFCMTLRKIVCHCPFGSVQVIFALVLKPAATTKHKE